MTILAIDTTSEFGSLAIRREGRDFAKRTQISQDGFAHVIFEAIQELLEESGVGLSEIDCFAAASGPGSFTGVRVGLAAIKGLAEAEGKLAIGISNLRALASFGNLPVRGVFLDARRNEIYAAVYNGALELVWPEVVVKRSDSAPPLPMHVDEWITQTGAFRELAGAIAYCAELDCLAGKCSDALAVDANYVRSSDAELFWKEN